MPIIIGNSGKNQQGITVQEKAMQAVYVGDKLVWQKSQVKLSGYVLYEKENSTFGGTNQPFNATLYLYNKNMILLATTHNDSTGYYEFTNSIALARAKYLRVSTPIVYGGLSSGDPLAISLRVGGTPPTYWIPADFIDYVADVNGDGDVTLDDADMVFDRHTGLISEFLGVDDNLRDWCFYCPDYDDGTPQRLDYYSANSMTLPYIGQEEIDIWARTFGDVRGTYNPGGGSSWD